MKLPASSRRFGQLDCRPTTTNGISTGMYTDAVTTRTTAANPANPACLDRADRLAFGRNAPIFVSVFTITITITGGAAAVDVAVVNAPPVAVVVAAPRRVRRSHGQWQWRRRRRACGGAESAQGDDQAHDLIVHSRGTCECKTPRIGDGWVARAGGEAHVIRGRGMFFGAGGAVTGAKELAGEAGGSVTVMRPHKVKPRLDGRPSKG